jgi:outer membrane protein OmpA-like peptidoglycan-associated protein
MKRQPRILAGTAIGLLMASAPLGAYPVSGGPADNSYRAAGMPVILAQAECEGEDCPPTGEERRREGARNQDQEAPAESRRERRQRERAQEQQEQAPAEAAPAEAAPEQEAPAESRRERRQRERQEAQQEQQEQAPAEAAPAEAAPEEAPAETRRERRQRERAQQEQEQQEQAPAEAAPAEAAPAEASPDEAPAESRRERRQRERAQEEQEQQQEQAPAEVAPAEAAPAEASPEEAPAETRRERRQRERAQEAQQEQEEQAPDQATGEQPSGEPAAEEAAPILDSQKEEAAPAEEGRRQRGDRQRRDGQGRNREQAEQAPVEQAPPPESDAAAQAPIEREQLRSVTEEEGQRIDAGRTREERQRFRQERRERRDDARVVERFDDNRVILEFGNRTFIDSPDEYRIIRDRDDVYYEELPRGRVREVVTRPNGVRIVTIRNRYGDIVRRSRIEPDNREVVLVYVEDRYYEDLEEWRDPGLDLPPMRLTIPREEYILESEYVDDSNDYYEFLEQPPVEQVERTYSLNEVKRSARIRDKVRRIDMDTLTFEFGSATIAESEIDKLEGVATAMEKLLDENPAETFLLEGHTDAVGSDLANLALSDKRAEAVAEALTNVFGIPPENLATQGYGEQYLKVDTQARERENRRVAIRRITPLVAPVASAN